jgi:hypothetical protein
MAAFDINAFRWRLFRKGGKRPSLPVSSEGSVLVPGAFQCFRMSQWVVISYVPEQS